MKKVKLLVALMSATSILAGCDLLPKSGSEAQGTVLVEGERIDAEVVIPEGIEFKSMSQEEKEQLFNELDQISTDANNTKSPISYDNISELKTEQAYLDFILDSQKEAKIIYLGFDECPYCKAFTPKISQFAKENNVTVYYYNTRKRANDSNFQTAMATYNVETVPHAFIVKNGKVVEKINHNNTMHSIEKFINKAVEMNQ